MQQNKFFFIPIFLLLVTVLFAVLIEKQQLFLKKKSFDDHQRVSAYISGKKINLEIVSSASSIIQGLSGREEIGADGMLFFLPETNTIPTFWMKEMNFDLDMIWLNDYKVVDISKNVPAPDPQTPLGQLPTYSPVVPANMVLEVNAGDADEWGVRIGDTLDLLQNN